MVEPAASLPRITARSGARLAIVTLEATPADDATDVFRADVTDVLSQLRRLVVEG